MLPFPYHIRYELIEFAVFTLATRAQGLAALHAACVGRKGRGLLLVGESGSGKSTLALHCLLSNFDFVSEDSVFVQPETLLATGVANFLHVRSDSLRFLAGGRDAAAIRKSPVIKRRSGVEKFEVDVRRLGYSIARAPQKLAAVVFASAKSGGAGAVLEPLRKRDLQARLNASQPYGASRPEWSAFRRSVSRLPAFELRRGRHPLEAVELVRDLLESRIR
jgi:energy-coupling factor transporter ATP-binding protein EcfA2